MRYLSMVFLVLCSTRSGGAETNPAAINREPLPDVLQALSHPDGKLYVAVAEPPRGDSEPSALSLLSIAPNGDTTRIAANLNGVTGLAVYQNAIFVSGRDGILRLDASGTAQPFVTSNTFPFDLRFIESMAIDPESGTLYAIAYLNSTTMHDWALCRITPQRQVAIITEKSRCPEIDTPGPLIMDGATHVLIADQRQRHIQRLNLANGDTTKIAEHVAASQMTWDPWGRLWILGDAAGLRMLPRPNAKAATVPLDFKPGMTMCVAPDKRHLLVNVRRPGIGTDLVKIPLLNVSGHAIDDAPLQVETELAFPQLAFAGWKGAGETGKATPLRPIELCHAHDGSNRLFVATQQGVIHVFPNNQAVQATKIFLDIEKRVSYKDNENEEGLLGFAFHPAYEKNGEFYVFYTTTAQRRTNVLSRFKVRKDNPDQADPDSEEELLRIANRPFWNHDGGGLVFGPDGHLYLSLGDGGSGNDPYDNGQSLNTLLGKILRIDVNRRDPGLSYAIPRDNPFVGRPNCRGEIWAYGLRNVWRMAFDRETKRLWAADVGQNLFEEIDLIDKGGNYGWNRREGLHPFGARGVGPKPDLIDPIWEYHHDLGKSITGGFVYRGKALPELQGHYVYADYISGRIWALRYDEAQKRVVANRPIPDQKTQFVSFGEDAAGEIYGLSVAANGKGIWRFVKREHR